MSRPDQPLVIGIGGTTRKDSSSEIALQACLASTAEQGARTRLFGAPDLCLPMYDPANTERTPAALRLIEAIAEADGIVIASPGYHGSLSGLVKNALDYVEDLRDGPSFYLQDRAVACIASASGWQAATTTLVALRSIVHALRGWPTPLGVAINSTLAPFGPDGEVTDPKLADQLAIAGRQVVEHAISRRAAM